MTFINKVDVSLYYRNKAKHSICYAWLNSLLVNTLDQILNLNAYFVFATEASTRF